MNRKCARCGRLLTNKTTFKASDAGPPSADICPGCGRPYEGRTNRRGTGAYYASEISQLGPGHLLCLAVLNSTKARSFESGLRLHKLWLATRQFCESIGRRVPTKGGLSGRLSELSGLGLVASAPNETELIDPASMKFRSREKSRWYLTALGAV